MTSLIRVAPLSGVFASKKLLYLPCWPGYSTKSPPASVLLAKEAGIEKGSGNPNSKIVGSISRLQLKEIAEIKLQDLNTQNIDKAMLIVSGTARSMGISIKD